MHCALTGPKMIEVMPVTKQSANLNLNSQKKKQGKNHKVPKNLQHYFKGEVTKYR